MQDDGLHVCIHYQIHVLVFNDGFAVNEHLVALDGNHFTGIFIHALNIPEDTRGCIGVGTRHATKPDWIDSSRLALRALLAQIAEGLAAGQVWIEIDEPAPAPAPTGEDAP